MIEKVQSGEADEFDFLSARMMIDPETKSSAIFLHVNWSGDIMEHHAHERLVIRGWLHLVDVVMRLDGLYRVFQVSPEAMVWLDGWRNRN